ncbi:efflux RND transporter periplasmic adaptor subunit [uncultured Holdemanella sp.]|uniref:efflux RND transporter periplasmic adaptor subunit n=1 Tax=uncultured Holdemanella sp. TaxID=1763549 RepID=UPI0028063CB0|nr:HlyD family efflux transporter periplasmic adaptor subunit [uncultured Holdemanella sp.]
MNKKTKNIILISLCILIALIGIYFLFPKGSNNGNIYVQKVSSVIGSSYTENRYSGVVESSETVDINSDGNKSITEMYVEAGQKVSKGQKLFSYDTTEASNSIAQKKLDIEAQNNEIAAQNNTIEDYKAELNRGADKVEIQARINDASYAIRQAQNTIKATQTEIDQLNKQIENSTVLSTIDGIIKEVNRDGGTDENGNQKPLVSITQTSDFRVKGSISEMGSISEGTNVIVRSRINENQVYKGTVTKVETDPQSNSNNNFYGNDSNESASKYPFYVTLDNNKGLKLGQHVYIEVDNGQSTKKKGIWLDASFIVSDENGNSYVWVSEKGKLKKRKVELGKTDKETFTTKIKSGLSEDDYIAWADDSYSEGMKTTTEYQTETDGDANASKS